MKLELKKNMNARKRHSLYVCLVITLVFISLALAMVTARVLEEKFGWVLDLSRSSTFSLSKDTLQALKSLNEDITFYAVYENGSRDMVVLQLLRTFAQSSEHISVEVLDPVNSPSELMAFTIQGNAIAPGSVVVSSADKSRFQLLDYYDFYIVGQTGVIGMCAEQSILSAIHVVHTGKTGRVYLTTGHKEVAPADMAEYITASMARSTTLAQLDTTTTDLKSVLSGDEMLLYVSPMTDLTDTEADALLDFLLRGGRAAFYMDNARSEDGGAGISFNKDELTNFNRVFAQAGLQVNRDLVLIAETKATLGSITAFKPVCIAGEALSSADLGNMVVSECASLTALPGAQNVVYVTVSPNDCYAKQTNASLISLDQEAKDPKGVFLLSAFGSIGKGKIYLSGSSSFVTGNSLSYEGNRRLALTAMSYLMDDPDHPVVLPTMLNDGVLDIDSLSQQVLLSVLVVVVLPLIILVLGMIVIKKRKNVK